MHIKNTGSEKKMFKTISETKNLQNSKLIFCIPVQPVSMVSVGLRKMNEKIPKFYPVFFESGRNSEIYTSFSSFEVNS